MSFVYPAFLFALFAIAIPIIIHLFNFRRFKRIPFTNVRFLREVKQETQSKSKLKHLLVLIARILAIASLVFAFAQPYLPVDDKNINKGRQAVSIYIDNSFSMDALNENGSILEQAKQYAADIVNAYQPTDQFQMLTNDFEGSHQRLVNCEEFIELLDELEISPAVKTLSEVVSRQKDALKDSETESKTLFLISDFQKSIADIEKIETDSTFSVRLIPLVAEHPNNLYVDSCWFSSPIRQLNQPEELTVRIRNNSDDEYENIPVKLHINGQQKALASFSIAARSYIDTTLYFTSTETGIHSAEIAITDYPITFDDRFYFSYEVAEHIPVLCINAKDTDSYINSLFGNDDFFKLTHSLEKNLDYSALAENKLILLAGLDGISTGLGQELKKFIANGGSVLVFPSGDIDINSYKTFLSSLNVNYYTGIDTGNTAVSVINLQHEVYDNVFEQIPENMDMPIADAHYRFSTHTRTDEAYLMKMRNSDVFLNQCSFSKGNIYLSAVPLNPAFSNFVKHAVFVPTLYKIALLSQPSVRLYHIIGKEQSIELSNAHTSGDKVFHIVSSSNDFDIIPEHKLIHSNVNLFLHGQIKEAGNYHTVAAEKLLAGISFNYERKESDLDAYNKDEIRALLEASGLKHFALLDTGEKTLVKALNRISKGMQLWRTCIIFTLIFFGFEILLLRFLK